MKITSTHRSTAALVVAALALFAALGGPSYAAKMITGKDIKNGTVTSKDIKNHTIGAADLKPAAVRPKLVTKRVAATPGADENAARLAAPHVLLYRAGSVSVYGKCSLDQSGPYVNAVVYAATKRNGALLQSDDDDFYGGPAATDFLNTDTAETDRELVSEDANLDNADADGAPYDWFWVSAPGGSIQGSVNVGVKQGSLAGGNGVFGSGNVCLFSGYFLTN